MAVALVVTEPFGSYQIGDRITDASEVTSVGEEYAPHVVRISLPDEPEPSRPVPVEEHN